MLFVPPGTRCTLIVQITNDSSHPVRVDTVTAGLLGEHAAAILQAVGASRSINYGVDAQWDLGHTIAPGATYRLPLRFDYRPSGCTQAYTSFDNFPAVHLTVVHWGFSAHGTRALRFVQRGGSPGCRRMGTGR